ncbi:quinone oxidoreductase family protein [Gynuella sunshinyii]|uniref:NADPH:quinone reductase and related Zn-dependent oxidoreductase n=1 Tax=Gynuella sunshinyii YC6258 TaxID=1445510 RepID=A0A0C5V1I4_9GAMM|nr:zinc-binding alcohol dehydrogenase family protein [Gynuella sunshinyii]AJQ93400.1 NADPH:quinone reductase and related Zn-dependent oxidoreductase [Gynuella sunshinyii YC6258]
MKAAVLKAFGHPLEIMEWPDPQLGTGEVLVEVKYAPVLPYMEEVISGKRQYLLEPPLVPGAGAVGRVLQVGPDATVLSPGDWVLCDATVRARDNPLFPDVALQGLSARGEGGLILQKYFRDGSFAEKIRVPTECVIPLGAVDASSAHFWCAMGTLLVPFGGLLAGSLQPGETVLISGATGNFGSSAVAVALAMGAGAVVTPGRNVAMLEALVARFGHRVKPVQLTGNAIMDQENMMAVAGPVDLVLDILPPSVPSEVSRNAVLTTRPYGRAVLMGGVGMLGGPGLELPYPWIMRNNITLRGAWMYSADTPGKLVRLVKSGQLNLQQWRVTKFPLSQIDAALHHAAIEKEPFTFTVVEPY